MCSFRIASVLKELPVLLMQKAVPVPFQPFQQELFYDFCPHLRLYPFLCFLSRMHTTWRSSGECKTSGLNQQFERLWMDICCLLRRTKVAAGVVFNRRHRLLRIFARLSVQWRWVRLPCPPQPAHQYQNSFLTTPWSLQLPAISDAPRSAANAYGRYLIPPLSE